METIFIDVNPEIKRQSLKDSIKKKFNSSIFSDGYLSDIPFFLNRQEWLFNKKDIEIPRKYNQANKDIISDINAQMAGADYLTSIANNVVSNLNLKLNSLDKEITLLQYKLNLIDSLESIKSLNSEIWVSNWRDDEDLLYKPTEANSLGDSYPSRCTITNSQLQLGVLSDFELYSKTYPATVLVDDWVGGDISDDSEVYKSDLFSKMKINLICEKLGEKSLNYFPWIAKKDNQAYLKLRINFPVGKVFSDISVKSGSYENSSIDSIYWCTSGKEFESSLCSTLMSEWTRINASLIDFVDSTISIKPIGISQYAVLNSGGQTLSSSGSLYTVGSKLKTTFSVSSFNEILRLNILWRGSGRFQKEDCAFVSIKFLGVSGNVIYEENKSLKQGLEIPNSTIKDEFVWSRFVITKPADCVSGSIEITSIVPNNYSDPFNDSIIEIAGVGLDRNAGVYTDSVLLNNTTVQDQGAYIRVPYNPEASVLYVVLASNTYKRDFYSGLFQYNFDFTLNDIKVSIKDYVYSSRWVSSIKKFNGEPRKFVLQNTDLPNNTQVRLSLRDNLNSVELSPNIPLVVLADGDVSLLENTITLNVIDKKESFSGTDISGRVYLDSSPHVSLKEVNRVASAISSSTNLVYDPNAINPLVRVI